MIGALLLPLLACDPEPAPAVDTSPTCVTDDEFYAAEGAAVIADCAGCHHDAGVAAGTTYVLVPGDDAENLRRLAALVAAGSAQDLLEKPTGRRSHAGGTRFDTLDPRYGVLDELVARLGAPGGCAHPGDPAITCDGTVRPGTAPLRRLTPDQYGHAVRALLGVEVDPSLFPATAEGDGFSTFADRNLVSQAGAEQVMLAAEGAAAAVDVDARLACAADADERACAAAFLLDFTERAFRRPLNAAERTLATRFLDAGLDVDTAVRMQIELVLQSPPFLYLDPVGLAEPADAPVRLDDHAIAARLAAFLADGLPDDALRDAAAAGELRTRDQVVAQAARLVAAPEATRAVARFHRDWLHLDRLDGAGRDEATNEAMRAELDLYTTEVVWSGDARFETLLLGQTTWVNAELAAIYGLPAPEAAWARVTLDAERPGALTRAGFLAAHAYATESAPVRRGAFVLEQLLCQDLQPPADVDMTLPEESVETPTVRERLAAHAADPACASCHDAIDPIGLSFEHFGALGEWRDTWANGYAVDATGSIPDALGDLAGDVDGAADLAALLATSPRARACYARRWFEYGVGRPAEDDDACSLRALSERFESSDGDLRQLVVDVTLTDAFLFRAPPEDE